MKFQFILVLALLVGVNISLYAQASTKVTGVVADADTKEPLSFVDVFFKGTTIGCNTDIDGTFVLETTKAVGVLVVDFLGYETKEIPINKGGEQNLKILLKDTNVKLNTVTVKAKRKRYKKKNNPAVVLMRKVIEHKQENSFQNKAYFSENKYQKIEIDINHITAKNKQNKLFKSFDFIWSYIDSSDVEKEPFLPILLKETYSTIYFKKAGNQQKEYQHAVHLSKVNQTADENNMDEVLSMLYQDVNIYDNTIDLLKNQFVSPLSPLAINFYHFYITDTLQVGGKEAIQLSFYPKNKSSFGFKGELVINNENYGLLSAKMDIFGDINLNFVRDIKFEQDFEENHGVYLLTKSKIFIDYYAINKDGIGMYGTKTDYFSNFSFIPPSALIFEPEPHTIVEEQAHDKDEKYWSKVRTIPLTKVERGVYEMTNRLSENKTYTHYQNTLKALYLGYIPLSKIDIGPYSNFLSYNAVEGVKMRFGAETNLGFSQKWNFGGHLAYGIKDKAYKYEVRATYSFNKNYLKTPRHYLSAIYTKRTSFPGEINTHISEVNFLNSFRWGTADKMILSNIVDVRYVKENKTFEYQFSIGHEQRQAYGSLSFNREGHTSSSKNSITTTELGVSIKYAPNHAYLLRGKYRYSIHNKYPIISLSYHQGFKGFLGEQYDYKKIEISAFKQLKWSIWGYSNIEMKAGRIWGTVPYVLLPMPPTNQTFFYKNNSFNMMNSMEFVGDKYLSFNFRHYFKGFFFNRIPLIKKLKWREVFTAKAIWGGLSPENNPRVNTNLPFFPNDGKIETTTYSLSKKPYVELSFGITNIFKTMRVDLVQRVTYLDHPSVPKLFGKKGFGIRFRFDVEF